MLMISHRGPLLLAVAGVLVSADVAPEAADGLFARLRTDDQRWDVLESWSGRSQAAAGLPWRIVDAVAAAGSVVTVARDPDRMRENEAVVQAVWLGRDEGCAPGVRIAIGGWSMAPATTAILVGHLLVAEGVGLFGVTSLALPTGTDEPQAFPVPIPGSPTALLLGRICGLRAVGIGTRDARDLWHPSSLNTEVPLDAWSGRWLLGNWDRAVGGADHGRSGPEVVAVALAGLRHPGHHMARLGALRLIAGWIGRIPDADAAALIRSATAMAEADAAWWDPVLSQVPAWIHRSNGPENSELVITAIGDLIARIPNAPRWDEIRETLTTVMGMVHQARPTR